MHLYMDGIVILGCGACFRSGLQLSHFLSACPSFDFDNPAHMWLMPINSAAPGHRGGTGASPPDHRPTSKWLCISLKLILPIRAVKHTEPPQHNFNSSVGSGDNHILFTSYNKMRRILRAYFTNFQQWWKNYRTFSLSKWSPTEMYFDLPCSNPLTLISICILSFCN